jgi:hypothetical protein
MNSSGPFVGYPGQVWGACWQAMSWFVTFLNGGATPAAQIVSAAETTFATMRNGVQAVNAWQVASTLSAESINLAAIQAMPLTLDGTTANYFNARIAAVAAVAQGVATLLPPIDLAYSPTICALGLPAVADPGLIEWCMNFAGEVPSNGVLITDGAAAMAASWAAVAANVAVLQGNATTSAYDAAIRMWRAANLVANQLAALTSGPFAGAVDAQYFPMTDEAGHVITDELGNVIYLTFAGATQPGWSQLVALPTILADASILMSAPSTLIAQQCGVIRYALIETANNLALLLLSLRQAQVGTASTTSLRNNETLMDLAARNSGDFEDWQNIAAINGMSPPYPGPSNGNAVGATLLLPSPGTGIPAPGTPVPSYAANVLGTDYDFGPINTVVDGQLAQGIMPPWAGDFNMITGYPNFRRAIGRRLQTTLGTLIYHTDYGSRIPPEVGAIQSQDEAAKLAAFARSAITMDPRTGSIVSCVATTQPNFLATVQAVLSPVGIGSTPVSISETLSPLP